MRQGVAAPTIFLTTVVLIVLGASSVDASAAVADPSVGGLDGLARLQALFKPLELAVVRDLELAAPFPQPMPELVPMPVVEEHPRVETIKSMPQAGFPNADDSIIVFDEVEDIVERSMRVPELPAFRSAGKRSALQTLSGRAAMFGASSVDASAAVANANVVPGSSDLDLARLQALVKQLEPAVVKNRGGVQRSRRWSKKERAAPQPMPAEEPAHIETIQSTPQAGFPNADDVIIVFDEVEASVERALRHLTSLDASPAPSPGAASLRDNGSGEVGSGSGEVGVNHHHGGNDGAVPPPPLAPGSRLQTVTGTQVVVTFKVAGDVSDFDEDTRDEIKARLQERFSCYPPECHATLRVTPASVNLELELISTAPDASALIATAEEVRTDSVESLSGLVGATVEESPEVAVTEGVTVAVTLAAPSPPPPLPPKRWLLPSPPSLPSGPLMHPVCGCEVLGQSFCNYDYGNSGLCEPCNSVAGRASNCASVGLPSAGVADCVRWCFGLLPAPPTPPPPVASPEGVSDDGAGVSNMTSLGWTAWIGIGGGAFLCLCLSTLWVSHLRLARRKRLESQRVRRQQALEAAALSGPQGGSLHANASGVAARSPSGLSRGSDIGEVAVTVAGESSEMGARSRAAPDGDEQIPMGWFLTAPGDGSTLPPRSKLERLREAVMRKSSGTEGGGATSGASAGGITRSVSCEPGSGGEAGARSALERAVQARVRSRSRLTTSVHRPPRGIYLPSWARHSSSATPRPPLPPWAATAGSMV